MSLSLSPETEALIRDEMKRRGYSTADALIRGALDALKQLENCPVDDVEAMDLRASIGQMSRGEGIDWNDLRRKIRGVA